MDLFAAANAGPGMPPVNPEVLEPAASQDASNIPAPLDLAAVRLAVEPFRAEVAALVKQSSALEVKDADSLNQAVGQGATLKKVNKRIEDLRKRILAPAQAFVKDVNNLCKSFQDALDGGERGLKQKISQYQTRLEMERREAQRKAEEAARKLQAEIDAEAKAKGVEPPKVDAPVVQEAPKTVRTEAGAAHQRTTWAFEIVDPAAVPREFLAVDEKAIREAVRAGRREIAGVRIYEKTETVFRA